MTHSYFPIGAMLAAFALMVGFMFITSRVSVAIRAGAAALAAGLAIAVWLNAMALMGYAVAAYPKDSGIVMSVMPDRVHGFVYAWVLQADGPRAYQMPFTSSEGQKLLEAMKKAGPGGIVTIRGARDGKGDKAGNVKGGHAVNDMSGGDPAASIEINVVPLLPPKDEAPTELKQ